MLPFEWMDVWIKFIQDLFSFFLIYIYIKKCKIVRCPAYLHYLPTYLPTLGTLGTYLDSDIYSRSLYPYHNYSYVRYLSKVSTLPCLAPPYLAYLAYIHKYMHSYIHTYIHTYMNK